MWKIDSKDRCRQKYKHDLVHIYIENMLAIVDYLMGFGGRRRGK
jgi:hypothetical protein